MCFDLGTGTVKRQKEKKLLMSVLLKCGFLFSGIHHQFYAEETCCQIEQQAAGEFSPGSHVSAGAVGK